MQINAVNSMYSYNAIKKNVKKDTNFCAAGAQRNPVLVGIYDPQEIMRKEKEYKEELVNEFFTTVKNDKGKEVKIINPEIKNSLDELEFEFEGPDGEKFTGSVKDALNAYIIDDVKDFEKMTNLLHGASQEAIEDMINNGINPMLYKRTVFGPGFYFAFSEGTAQDYSSAKMQADVKKTTRNDGTKARVVRFDGDFYSKVSNSALTQAADGIMGLETGYGGIYNPFLPDYNRLNREFVAKVVDEYCRDILVNELNIDAGFGNARGYHSCLVVFNPDSIENMENYSARNNNFYY